MKVLRQFNMCRKGNSITIGVFMAPCNLIPWCIDLLTLTCFCCRTYSTLIGGTSGKGKNRLQQVVDWCGGDGYDGCIVSLLPFQ